MIAARFPAFAALIAARCPPGPDPITIKSYFKRHPVPRRPTPLAGYPKLSFRACCLPVRSPSSLALYSPHPHSLPLATNDPAHSPPLRSVPRVLANIRRSNAVTALCRCPTNTPPEFPNKPARESPHLSPETRSPPAHTNCSASSPRSPGKLPALRHSQNKISGCAPETAPRCC